ncbi:MAG: PSD1 and planctomycete cytochrome C domain-containing protein [Bryobacteraceae bacterium]
MNRIGILGLCSIAAALWAQAPEEREFFEKQVRPLLVSRCHSCHSSSAKTRFAGLALDTAAGLRKGSDTGPVVIAGKPEESRLLLAVRGKLPARMPPTGPLSEAEIAVLARWVALGALWPAESAAVPPLASFDIATRKREHWAWQPVQAAEPPAVRDSAWPLQPVDRFLLATLVKRGLTPAPPADLRTLIRRLSFDLTGLPPTPEEIHAFEQDSAADAYLKLVDRLLESPRFGERWARHWMDVIRYSESHGSEGDPDIPLAWRYRDYLIRALNQDVPYDQLIREHLAGDLLRSPRLNREERLNESMLGVANLRMVEHGFQPVDPWEDRIKWTDNQIDVFSKAFQGLTISCARCHDHKFDAISQEDYYALFGVLGGARPTQAAVDLPEDLNRHRNELRRQKRDVRLALAAAWRNEIGQLPTRLEGKAPDPEGSFAPWFALKGKEGVAFRDAWQALRNQAEQAGRSRADFNRRHFRKAWDLREDYARWVGRGSGLTPDASRPGEFQILPEGPRILSGIYPGGVYSHGLSTRHGAVLTSPRFRIDTDYLSLRMLGGNFSSAQLIVENYAVPRGGIYLMRFSPKGDKMGWARWETAFWKGFTAYLEFATRDDVTLFQLDEEDGKRKPRPEPVRDGRSYFGAQLVYVHNDKETPKDELVHAALVLREEPPAAADALIKTYQRLIRQSIDAWESDRLTEEQAALLDDCVRGNLLTSVIDESSVVAPLVAVYRRLEAEIPVARRAPGVLDEGAPDQPLLVRGNPKNPGRPVSPRYLKALGGDLFPERRSARLRLAEKVASADNPLTARVMVNRIWAHMFGAGLVRTVDNFGKLGETPSHPELLDWLATRFVRDGWSIKKMIRLLATTRAYQMSSQVSPEALRADPGNRLLSRMPVRRLEAEAIRDAMLAVSGELDPAMYGPPVDTYYGHDTGKTKGDKPKGPLDGNGRRSIYLEVRRNVTNPFLEVFDVPKPSTTRGERDRTNVPAQPLALMNSPFVIDQAAKWAQRITAQGSAADLRIAAMWERALGRSPSAVERDQARSLVESLATEQRVPAESPIVWRDFAQAIFNLKEFLYVR